MFVNRDPILYLSSMLAIFLILPIHEWAHAYTAYLLGDHTAKWEGRLSINPMRHLSLWGSICLLCFGFGWAKPVPINPYNLTKVKDPKIGFAICSLAGPISNFLMAVILNIIFKILQYTNISGVFLSIIYHCVLINIYLMVFNLLPIPPLDGSRIWGLFLKEETYNKLLINEHKIIFIIYILLFTGVLSLPLNLLSNIVLWFINLITWFIK